MRTRILVVDDDEAIRLTVSEFLLDEGFDVDTAHDADSGFVAIRKGTADVVLLDLWLGGGRTGLDVIRDVLRSRHPPLPAAVILTASGAEEVRQKLDFEPELDRLLFPRGRVIVYKPFRSQELLSAIVSVLAR